jgi:hypothetical protein
LQIRLAAAERAHKAATDDMERQQAAAKKSQSDLLVKRKKLDADVKKLKNAEVQRAVLASKVMLHTYKILELTEILAVFQETKARALHGQGITKGQQVTVESDIYGLQIRMWASELAHKSATDDLEKQQAVAKQLQSDILVKRRKWDADDQAILEEASDMNQANSQSADEGQAAGTASSLQANQHRAGASSTTPGSASSDARPDIV